MHGLLEDAGTEGNHPILSWVGSSLITSLENCNALLLKKDCVSQSFFFLMFNLPRNHCFYRNKCCQFILSLLLDENETIPCKFILPSSYHIDYRQLSLQSSLINEVFYPSSRMVNFYYSPSALREPGTARHRVSTPCVCLAGLEWSLTFSLEHPFPWR